MGQRRKISTRELGLLLISRVIKDGDLHYGYWPEGMDTRWGNLRAAQEAYTDLLIDHIPDGVETILDVGMGTGGISKKLTEKGYRVEGVSPEGPLTELAVERLGDAFTIHPCRFQELQTDKRYDLVLFAESFQYIPPHLSFPKLKTLLNPGGHVLIIDFFRTDSDERGPVGGGHRLSGFRKMLAGQPFTVLKDVDITPETAPTIDLMGQILRDYVRPIYIDMTGYFRIKHPWWSRFSGWVLARRLERIRKEVFSDRFSGECFCRSHSYRLMLLGRTRMAS
jgi:SAM-dependent methyltransferase